MKELPNTFHVRKVGKNKIDLSCGAWRFYEFRPIEFFIKDDGAKDDGPSFAIVGKNLSGAVGIMQVSAKMFRVVYEDLKEIYEPKV